jgi:hypothetical protein
LAIPTKENETLPALNPLTRIPTLQLNTGEVFFYSTRICEYRDEFSDGGLLPESGPARRQVLKLYSSAPILWIAAASAANKPFDRKPIDGVDGWMLNLTGSARFLALSTPVYHHLTPTSEPSLSAAPLNISTFAFATFLGDRNEAGWVTGTNNFPCVQAWQLRSTLRKQISKDSGGLYWGLSRRIRSPPAKLVTLDWQIGGRPQAFPPWLARISIEIPAFFWQDAIASAVPG